MVSSSRLAIACRLASRGRGEQLGKEFHCQFDDNDDVIYTDNSNNYCWTVHDPESYFLRTFVFMHLYDTQNLLELYNHTQGLPMSSAHMWPAYIMHRGTVSGRLL